VSETPDNYTSGVYSHPRATEKEKSDAAVPGTDALPTVTFDRVNLEDLERAAYAGEFEEATKLLIGVLQNVNLGLPFAGREELRGDDITRVAAVMIALVSHPKFYVSGVGLNTLMSHYGTIDAVFKTTALGTSEIVFQIMRPGELGLSKYIPFFPLDSPSQLDLEKMFRKDPQGMFATYLAMIGHPQVYSEVAHDRREQLLEMWDIFSDVKLTQDMYRPMGSAYMNVSYASGRNKHGVKGLMHRLLSGERKVKPLSPLQWKEKPTILVPLEWWNSHHAMYRVNSKSILQLRDRFHLIGMIQANKADDKSKEVFDEVIEISEKQVNLNDLLEQIDKIGPDIVYYPSIGMSIWVVALASCRVAPIQVHSYGHPATTNSEVIDYSVIEEDIAGDAPHSEEMITMHSGGLAYVPYAGHEAMKQKCDPYSRNEYKERVVGAHYMGEDDPIHIAVPAMHSKLSWPFVRCLQEVEKRSKRPVHFHFHAYVGGVGKGMMQRQMGSLLKNVAVYQRSNYEQYMELLSKCDLALFSFPFGGTNSTIDAILLGLPIVAMYGDEPHARTDAMIMRRSGLPESLIAHSEAEYIDIVMRLIEDPGERLEIHEAMNKIDVGEKFYSEDKSKGFLGAFNDIYSRHAIKAAA